MSQKQIKILGVIPARYASTRFPGKPLVDINGKTMIMRVYEQASKSFLLDEVVVATDDERIYNHVLENGGKAMMTSTDNPTGTDRCYEALQKIKTNFDAVVNIQGDEPFIDPSQIDDVAKLLIGGSGIATLVKKIERTEDLFSDTIMKVVFDAEMNALYFSRSPIPFIRGKEKNEWLSHHTFYKHIGIYGFKHDELKKIVSLPQSSLEKAESLEQLRWLQNGMKIKISITDKESISVDVPEDLEKF